MQLIPPGVHRVRLGLPALPLDGLKVVEVCSSSSPGRGARDAEARQKPKVRIPDRGAVLRDGVCDDFQVDRCPLELRTEHLRDQIHDVLTLLFQMSEMFGQSHSPVRERHEAEQ